MSFWTLNNFKEVTAGRILHRPVDDTELKIQGLSTDTRALNAGQAFLALRGDNFDGHNYLQQAIDHSAAILIIDSDEFPKDIDPQSTAVLRVSNTLTALAQLAAAYRKTLKARVIGVTGSVGKTTTKSIIGQVLSVKYKGTISPKSFNNAIGVPLTILAADPTDAYLVVEIGTNAPGEIGALSKIVQPDIAIITAVGRAHTEGLGTLDAITKEKSSILSHLTENGLAIINGDYAPIRPYYKLAPTVLTFGENDENDLRITDCDNNPDGIEFTVNNRQSFTMPLLGRHNAVNALAAIAVARAMQLTDDEIATGLKNVTAPDMRLNIETLGEKENTVTLINDAYNANPDSVKAAIDVICEINTPGTKRIILGDMAELGDVSPDMHRQIGQYLGDSNVDHAILVGPMSLYTIEALSRHWAAEKYQAFSDFDDATLRQIANLIQPGDVVLIKASRTMRFERLADVIRERFQGVHL